MDSRFRGNDKNKNFMLFMSFMVNCFMGFMVDFCIARKRLLSEF